MGSPARSPSTSWATVFFYFGIGFLIGVTFISLRDDLMVTVSTASVAPRAMAEVASWSDPLPASRRPVARPAKKKSSQPTEEPNAANVQSRTSRVVGSEAREPAEFPTNVTSAGQMQDVNLVAMDPDCDEKDKALNCHEVCKKEELACDVGALKRLNTKFAVGKAAEEGNVECDKTEKIDWAGVWDGPWVRAGACGFNPNAGWVPSCAKKPPCGFVRICTCTGKRPAKTRETEETGTYKPGGPVWPAGAASAYDWAKAVEQVYRVPRRMFGLEESIFANTRPSGKKDCGKPCVAHCVAGQPRDLSVVPGLVKSIRHRLFDKMSSDAVSFAVLVASAMMSGGGNEGDLNYARASPGAVSDRMLEGVLQRLTIDRALILRERCANMKCMRKHSGFSCNAKEFGLTQFVNKTGYVNNICDVQFRRFQTCMNLVREYEKDFSIQVEWVTRQRPDVYWTRPSGPIAGQAANAVYLHGWAACGYGGGDWFYYAPRRLADVIARFPDEMTCPKLKHPDILPNPCKGCLGCECMLVAWLRHNDIQIRKMPYDFCTPAKFCGEPCPHDWKTSEKNINAR